MKIVSPVFKNNEHIPSKYTCDGKNINPPLEFTDIPDGAKSLVLIVDDPDAPNETFVHWVLYNIDPLETKIEENSSSGMEGLNSAGKPGYFGPCPPVGTHRYFFKLYAVDTYFDIGSDLTKKDIEEMMHGNIVSSAELIGLYGRK